MDVIKNAILEVSQRSSEVIQMNDSDYIKDGLAYCHKCNTPKQCIVPFNGGYIKPMCLCDCEVKRINQEKEELKKAQAQARNQAMRKKYIRDDKLLNSTFKQDLKQGGSQSNFFQRYCNKWEIMKKNNVGLCLWGNTGGGKSFYAGCIANYLVERGKFVYATTEPQIINEMCNIQNKVNYLNKLINSQLLIIDDFGAGRNTEFAIEQIFMVIDGRYKKNLPIVITTNLSPDDFENPVNIEQKRIFERVKAMCQMCQIKGEDWRKRESENKSKIIMEELLNGK